MQRRTFLALLTTGLIGPFIPSSWVSQSKFSSRLDGYNPDPADIDSLIPKTAGTAPDYFCTWNVQGYICSYLNNEAMRAVMNQKNIFGSGQYQNWIQFYAKIRKDLYFIMDDSWDIPQTINTKHNIYMGSAELSTSRFPSYTGLPQVRLKKLVSDIEAQGWEGLGGWICAQEASAFGKINQEDYWIERIKAANVAGFNYWKVDWGKHAKSVEWRKMLTDIGRKYAPNLTIEHAMKYECIEFSDVFRTYDVENIISQPVTIQRIVNLLPYKKHEDARGLINCEDEPYIAAGLGCAIGVMRHPFDGTLPDGKQDFVFPPVGRDLKKRLDEVVRGVRWHRIADPFGVGTVPYEIDPVKLTDYWILGKRETYVRSRHVGDKVTASAPARVSRGLALPEISNLHTQNQPFVLASRYPSGAVAIVTAGRAKGRKYVFNRETVKVKVPEMNVPFGIFGDYKELVFEFPQKIDPVGIRIYGQDLAGEKPVNITDQIKINKNKVVIPGDLIRKIGLMAATKGDISDAGMILNILNGASCSRRPAT